MKRFFTIFIAFPFILNVLLPTCSEGTDYTKAEEESRIGNLFDLYVTESFVILRDDNLTEKVTRIVEKIAKASDNPDVTYHVRVINDLLPIVSSFPGYIYISTGMLDILENEDELAAVIAHAIAHVNGKDQYDTYLTAWRMKKIAFVTGYLMPFLMAAGGGVGAITGVAMSGQTSATFLGVGIGIYLGALPFQIEAFKNMEREKVAFNRVVPYLSFPFIKSNLSVLVFLEEMCTGYKEDKEMKADELAIGYLHWAGYNPEALVSVFNKLLGLKNKGYISHFLIAKPGLEKRVENANQVFEKHK